MSEPSEKDFLLEIYYSTKGNLDEINAVIDSKLKKNRTRKISIFENFIKSRLSMNSKILRMANMQINPIEATYLSIYPGIEEVEILDLRQNHIADEGVEAIARSPLLINLHELDLRNNHVTRLGMQAILGSKNFMHLEKLDLRINKLGGKLWLERLQKSENFKNLRDFKIGGS